MDRDKPRRMSELSGLEMINISNGDKYGYFGDCDITFDKKTGEIKTILVGCEKQSFFSFKEDNYIEIPWNTVNKVCNKTIIFEYDVK